jgi:hypothetical protein
MPVILAIRENRGSKPAQANSLQDPISKKKKKKKPFTKRAGGVVQGIDPEFKPQYGRKAKISTKALQTSKACRGMLGTILYT